MQRWAPQAQLGLISGTGFTTCVSTRRKRLGRGTLQGCQQITKITIVRCTHAEDLLYQKAESVSLTTWATLLSRKISLAHKLCEHIHCYMNSDDTSPGPLLQCLLSQCYSKFILHFPPRNLSVYSCNQIFQNLTHLLPHLNNLVNVYGSRPLF